MWWPEDEDRDVHSESCRLSRVVGSVRSFCHRIMMINMCKSNSRVELLGSIRIGWLLRVELMLPSSFTLNSFSWITHKDSKDDA